METAQGLGRARDPANMKVCIVGASGKLGQYMVQHALDRGYQVVGVCREESVAKLDAFKGRMTVIPGATDNREVISKAVAGCERGPHRAGPARCPRVLEWDGSGGARPRVTGRAPGVLLRVAHLARRPGRLLVEAQVESTCPRGDRQARPGGGPGRSGRSLPARIRQRYAVDRRARKRPRRGRQPGPARVRAGTWVTPSSRAT